MSYNNRFWDDKKGAHQILTLLVVLFAVFGIISAVLWFSGKSKTASPTGLSVQPTGASAGAPASGNVIEVQIEDTTVTFASWDFYAEGTNAGSGHYVLKLGNRKSVQVNDDASLTASPGNDFVILLGNLTTTLTAGTGYYPVVRKGTVPNDGTYDVVGGQYGVAGVSQVTYTFKNDVGTVATAVALGANDNKVVSWLLRAGDNDCVGNPDTGGENLMNYQYNSSRYDKVVQLDTNGKEQVVQSTPNSVVAVADKVIRSYAFPTVCDNVQIERSVLLDTGANQPASTNDNINMTVSDVTWDYHADTLELIKGVQDESNNDIGVADFALSGIQVS